MADPRLTKKDKQTLIAIRDFIRENRYPPTIRELGKILGLSSTSTVYNRIKRLIDLGYLEKNGENNSRTLRFAKRG